MTAQPNVGIRFALSQAMQADAQDCSFKATTVLIAKLTDAELELNLHTVVTSIPWEHVSSLTVFVAQAQRLARLVFERSYENLNLLMLSKIRDKKWIPAPNIDFYILICIRRRDISFLDWIDNDLVKKRLIGIVSFLLSQEINRDELAFFYQILYKSKILSSLSHIYSEKSSLELIDLLIVTEQDENILKDLYGWIKGVPVVGKDSKILKDLDSHPRSYISRYLQFHNELDFINNRIWQQEKDEK